MALVLCLYAMMFNFTPIYRSDAPCNTVFSRLEFHFSGARIVSFSGFTAALSVLSAALYTPAASSSSSLLVSPPVLAGLSTRTRLRFLCSIVQFFSGSGFYINELASAGRPHHALSNLCQNGNTNYK
jgi:hypothetical protein